MNTTNEPQTRKALDHYHASYNNDTYRAVQVAVIADLFGDAHAQDPDMREVMLDKKIPNQLMNLFSDAALEICGLPSTQGSMPKLVNLVVHHGLSPKTITLMRLHIENFESEHSTFSVDFENTALSLLKIAVVRETVQDAVSLSSAVHGTKGRAAHYLLKSAAAFLHAAEVLLKRDDSKTYLDEKLSQGTYALADAVGELAQTTE